METLATAYLILNVYAVYFLFFSFNLYCIFFLIFSPFTPPSPSNPHTVVHVHESFFLFAQSLHPLLSPDYIIKPLAMKSHHVFNQHIQDLYIIPKL